MTLVYLFIIVASVCALALCTAYVCYRKCFYSPPRAPLGEPEDNVPTGKRYEEYREDMINWVRSKRAMKSEELTATSFDGLTLRAKYYEYAPDAPIEILFHGYKGNAERDLSGAIERCFSLGRSAVLADQRAAGDSEGHVISFGINECRDCLVWIDRVIERFGSDVSLVIGGVSMGAATVIMASAEDLPSNVKYAVADCSYTHPRDIIKKAIKEMGLPPKLLYPFVRLGARLFGRFSLESNSPITAAGKSRIPVIFLHGEADDFVPCGMSQSLFEACASQKKLVTVPNADHGLAYPADKMGYVAALKEFEKEIGVFQISTVKGVDNNE